MGFDMEDAVRQERVEWLKRIKKTDPVKAALFCGDCTAYLGAGKKECDCGE